MVFQRIPICPDAEVKIQDSVLLITWARGGGLQYFIERFALDSGSYKESSIKRCKTANAAKANHFTSRQLYRIHPSGLTRPDRVDVEGAGHCVNENTATKEKKS